MRRHRTFSRRRLAVAVALAALCSAERRADASGSAARCAESAERAQSLWKHGKLIAARVALRECLKPACPTVVRDDCTAWDPQIDAATPTVVVASKSAAGDDLSDVVVTIDGANLSDSGSGLASAIDPGSHLFRFEHAGSQAVVRTVVIREGEKRRLVQVTFENATKTSRADGSQRAPFTPSTTTADGTRPSSAGPPVLTWVLGGAGVAALGAFAVLGLTGLDGYHALQNECGKTRSCTPSEIHGVRTQLWIADALGIAGVLAVGTAAWLWIATPSGRIAVGPQSIHFAGSF